jgi:hypothetical protein
MLRQDLRFTLRQTGHSVYWQQKVTLTPTVTVHRNPVASKKFLTKTLLKMIHSSITSLRKHDYDHQNYLWRQKLGQYGTKIRRWDKNRSITKKFPIKLVFQMMDSSIKNIGEFQYDKWNCLWHQKTLTWPKNLKWGLLSIAIGHKSADYKKINAPDNFTYHIRIPQGFLC